ncbi:MAG: 23S rRNA (uracil(1939)-C(5))-methyltransferase RlmD [Planctomycetes bacterium]|nr:23S rRNA (uracil(1939)-C(5))-methyltransferase RlmD [Planctomycetota bacterium]
MTGRRARGRPRKLPAARRGGEVVEVRLERATLEGDVVGRAATGAEVRVFGGLPGERVQARLRPGGPAELVAVLEPSPHRVRPPCPNFGPCGGCAWQHVAYEEQLRLKQRLVADLLGPGVEVRPTLPTPGAADEAGPWGFRAKVHFVVGPAPGGRGVVLGHYRRGTQDLLPVEECPVHDPEGNRLAFAARDALARRRVPAGVALHVLARVGVGTGQTQLTLVTRDERVRGLRDVGTDLAALERPPTGVHHNVHPRQGPYILGPETRRLHGRERLLEEVAGARFLVSPAAFFQTNVRAAALLVDAVLARVPDDRAPVLDLFSGVGLFSLPLARRGHPVLAVEESAAAVRDGAASLRLNDLSGLRFVAERAQAAARRLRDEGRTFPSVVLDPPREGCPPGLLDVVLGGLAPARVVYVSCNPEALARDLAHADRLGWRAAHVQPVDMFPHTGHVEAVALLEPPPRRRR